jgi:hypothetical protein
MGLLDKLRRKKAKPKEVIKKDTTVTNLEKICGDDKECYEALRDTMYLDPRKIGTSLVDAAKKAKEFEKQGDTLEAKTWYKTAGGLAICERDVAKVKEYFGKCAKLSQNEDYPILRDPEKAVKKAQEYYQKYLT